MLEKMNNLNSLFLVNNEIEVLDADTFQGNQMLNEIDLQNNQLKAIAAGTFEGWQVQIDLTGNSCPRFDSPNWYYQDCIKEYNRRKSSTISSTTTESNSGKSFASTTKPNETNSENSTSTIIIFSLLMVLISIIILLILIKRFSKTGATQNPLVSSTSAQGHGQDSSRPSELIYADLDMARGQAPVPVCNLVTTGRNNNFEETQYATIQDVSQQSVTYASIGDFAPVVPRHLKK
jgi:hypothetical protein